MDRSEMALTLAKLIDGHCPGDIRHCRLRTLRALYMGCTASEIYNDLINIPVVALEAKLFEHEDCKKNT